MKYLMSFILLSFVASAQAAVSFSFNAGDYTNVRTNSMTLSWGSTRYVKMKITNNANCSGGSWGSTSKSPRVSLADADGLQSMSVQLKTKRGELSPCVSDAITLDRQAPTGSLSVGAIQTSPTVQVSLTVSASDNTKISSMSLMEASTCSSPVWGSVVEAKTLTLSNSSGTKTIAFQLKDVAGNLSSCQTKSVVVEIAPTPVPTAVPVPSPTSTPTPVPDSDGELHVDGKSIKDSAGNVVQLRGVNIPDPEHLNTKYWERPGVSAISVAQKAIEEFNVNVVRIPVLPGTSSYPNEGWFSTSNGGQKYYDQHLKPLVDYITGQKVYAIIDLHYISDYSSLYTNVASFWTFIAPKFKDNPYVIYEMFNEPIYPDNWSTWLNTIAQPITNLIRSYAPNNLIIVGGPYWSSHMSGAATNPVVGNNIVYTAHVYSNQKSSNWEANYGATMAKYPMFVTEWGFENGGTEGGTASAYGEPFLAWMETNRLSWTAWCFDYLWGPKMFDSNWNLTVPDGGMGTFVRDALLSNQ